MAAPAFASVGTVQTITGSTGATPWFDFTVPASVAANDIVVIIGQIADEAEATPVPALSSSGFTTLFQYNSGVGAGHYTQVVLWKRATGGDTGTYRVQWTDNGSTYDGTVTIMRVTGGKTSGDCIHGTSSHQQGTNATNFPNTSIANAPTDVLGVAVYGCFSTGTLTGPTATGTWVQRYAGGAGVAEHAFATQAVTAGGTIAASGASWSVSDGEMDSILFLILSDTSTSNSDLSVSTIGEPVVGGSTF